MKRTNLYYTLSSSDSSFFLLLLLLLLLLLSFPSSFCSVSKTKRQLQAFFFIFNELSCLKLWHGTLVSTAPLPLPHVKSWTCGYVSALSLFWIFFFFFSYDWFNYWNRVDGKKKKLYIGILKSFIAFILWI